MKYKVTFRKRFNRHGDPADNPNKLLDVADDVIEDAEFLEVLEPAGLHVTEDLDAGSGSESAEDDGFLAFGSEIWVYTIAEGREDEFRDAVRNSEVALDIEEVPDESLTT